MVGVAEGRAAEAAKACGGSCVRPERSDGPMRRELKLKSAVS